MADFDILPTLKGEDPHARTATRGSGILTVRGRPFPVGRSIHRGTRSTGRARQPSLLSAAVANSEVPLSLAVPTYPDGGLSSLGRMHPSLADCPGVGAGVPRRMDNETRCAHLKPRREVNLTDVRTAVSPPYRVRVKRPSQQFIRSAEGGHIDRLIMKYRVWSLEPL